MPSAWDLKQEELQPFGEIEDVVRSRKGHCSSYDRLALLKMYHTYGHAMTLFVIDRCMANDWLKPDRWTELMELVVKYEIERVRVAIKQMNKLENHSIATVEGLLNGSIQPVRKPAGAKPEPARPIVRTYPPKDHRYSQADVRQWMDEHHQALAAYREYFEFINSNCFELKSEYR